MIGAPRRQSGDGDKREAAAVRDVFAEVPPGGVGEEDAEDVRSSLSDEVEGEARQGSP